MKTIVALFDCDGTLYSARFGHGLLEYAAQEGRKRATQAYYASVFFPYLLGKFGLVEKEKSTRSLILQLPKLIRGLSEEEADKGFDWIVQEYLLPTQKADVISRLRGHQVQGHMIVLVSGVLVPALAHIAHLFNANGFVGTQVEVRTGKYTGRIIPPVMTGDDKERYTREFFSSHDIEVDWNASYAYADSITDLGLFKMVGNPVAVYPDAKLQAHAEINEWEMIGSRQD